MMRRREAAIGFLGFGAGIAVWPALSTRAQQVRPDLAGSTVNIRDYCAADGRTDDSARYQTLLDRSPSRIIYPSGSILTLGRTINLRSGQLHDFANGSSIIGNVAGPVLGGVGATGQNLGAVTHAIERGDTEVALDRTAQVSVGEMLVLADVSDPRDIRIDVNEVAATRGARLTLRYPVGRTFASPRAIRIYHVYAPLQGIRLRGPVAFRNRHPRGGFLRVTHARDFELSGATLLNAGQIGLAFEGGLEGRFSDIAIRGAGASGLGFRASRNLAIDGLTAENVRGDESLTFYDNVSNATATNLTIRQYLFSESSGRSAGNNILIDSLCMDIALKDVDCSGSSTYNVMINDRSDRCSIERFRLVRSNLGGIRVSGACRGTSIGTGSIADVIDTLDQEGRKQVSAITIGDDCTGTRISPDISFSRVATGAKIGSLKAR